MEVNLPGPNRERVAKLREEGWTPTQIARKVGISRSRVYQIFDQIERTTDKDPPARERRGAEPTSSKPE